MQRLGSIPLPAALVVLVLAVTLHAQVARGHGAGLGRGDGGHHGAAHLETHAHHRRQGRGTGGFIDPLWYGGYDEPTIVYESPEPPPALPAAIAAPEPQRIPTAPKMMEIPAAAKSAASKPLPPALFILSSGERIESRHYLLSVDRVQITVDRRRRSIPLEALDLDATVAANRQRGLELHIPSSGSEISLGF
jgi:hypothetical protein